MAIETEALTNINANFNVAIGFRAGYMNTIGHHLTGIGAGALRNNTEGTYNTAIGADALRENDGSANTAVGVAEDVEKVNPDLVIRDKEGKPYTVRYDAVSAMLLNEFLKAYRKIEEQDQTISQLKLGMQTLTATVKEQATEIKKVSAQLEMSKPAPHVVNR
jgi:hypothetical protein